MKFENILFEVKDKIAIITMNRPAALNALNDDTLKELDMAVDEIEKNKSIKGAIITGSGKSFIAGADIGQMSTYDPIQARAYMERGQGVLNKIEKSKKPFLAAINGYALGGGCEISMACDFRFASEKAVFGQPEVNLGIIPGFGGTQRLPRLVNTGLAKELIYSARMVKAEEALRIGLVNRICEADKLMDESLSIMKEIAAKPASAIRASKDAINNGLDGDIYKALELEIQLISLCFAGKDQKEGMKAFLEKRQANFES